MADIKMDFNGDVSIDKMFDIHDNQQVAIYNNSNNVTIALYRYHA